MNKLNLGIEKRWFHLCKAQKISSIWLLQRIEKGDRKLHQLKEKMGRPLNRLPKKRGTLSDPTGEEESLP